MTDLSDELAAKKAAICEAPSSTKPTVPAYQVIALLKADLNNAQTVVRNRK